jgi:hypothetical protein
LFSLGPLRQGETGESGHEPQPRVGGAEEEGGCEVREEERVESGGWKRVEGGRWRRVEELYSCRCIIRLVTRYTRTCNQKNKKLKILETTYVVPKLKIKIK